LLLNAYRQYLRADQRACVAAIENLWDKYAITAREFVCKRDEAEAELEQILLRLGYA